MSTRHLFQQAPGHMLLCDTCGMWPEHHNHHLRSGFHLRCVCAVCMPDAEHLPHGTVIGRWWEDGNY